MSATTDTLEVFADGYRIGYHTGWDHGHHWGEVDADAIWSQAIAGIKAAASDPTHQEIERRRAVLPEDGSCLCPPCALRRSAVAKRGGDYLGGGVAA